MVQCENCTHWLKDNEDCEFCAEQRREAIQEAIAYYEARNPGDADDERREAHR